MTKKFLTYSIIFGIALRLILAVTTYHGDLAALVLAGKSLAVNHQFIDFYESVFTVGKQGELKLPDHKMIFIYQPLAYFLPGLFYLPFGGFINNIWEGLLHTGPYLLENKIIYLPLLIFKFPLILADLAIIWFLPMLFKKQNDKNLSQVLWALNPLAIYVSSMIAQVDALLTFFLVVGLVAFKQNRFLLSAFLFTLSALVKPIGLILLPIVAIYSWQKTKNLVISLQTFFVGLLTYALVIAPFLPSVAYRQYTLFAEHINKTLFAGIAIAPGTLIPLFFITYALVTAFLIKQKISPLMALGTALLSSLAFTHFHPQWFVWLTPWLIYYVITTKDWFSFFLTIIAWLTILFSFENSLTFGIFFGLGLSAPAIPTTVVPNLLQLVFLSRAWLIALFPIFLLSHETKK